MKAQACEIPISCTRTHEKWQFLVLISPTSSTGHTQKRTYAQKVQLLTKQSCGNYSASGLKSKLFVFSVLWHILLSISSIECHKRVRFGENVAELLLVPYICINHIENESRYHIYSILYTKFFRQSAKSL